MLVSFTKLVSVTMSRHVLLAFKLHNLTELGRDCKIIINFLTYDNYFCCSNDYDLINLANSLQCTNETNK